MEWWGPVKLGGPVELGSSGAEKRSYFPLSSLKVSWWIPKLFRSSSRRVNSGI